MGYQISIPGETSRIRFVVVIPKTMPGRQKILSIDYSPEPQRLFNRNGNRYAEFVFRKPQRLISITVTIKAELFRYDLATARKNAQETPPDRPDLEPFLRQERFIEKDNPRIQQIANQITARSQTETVRKVCDYVIDNMDYAGLLDQESGALRALEEKKGDCSEYSDLFVALCRAKNIPARFMTGYTVRFDDIPPKHHWVEVYLDKYGWVPFDPSWGDVEGTVRRNMAFKTMKPVYIYLSHLRSDPALHNSHFYSYTYWGDKATLKDTVKFKTATQTTDQKP